MSTELHRIDPVSVPGLFVKHGLRPKQWHFGFSGLKTYAPKSERCGCLMTVLGLDALGTEKLLDVVGQSGVATFQIARAIGLDHDYAMGLRRAWDDVEVVNARDEKEVFGHADGRAAWLACQAAGLCSEPTS